MGSTRRGAGRRLEVSGEVLIETNDLWVPAQVEHEIEMLGRKLGLDQEGADVQ